MKVDVRLISTSNRDVKEAILKKSLREDLYYRLNVVPIYLPPLRERKEDIIPLAQYFLEKFCDENHKESKELASDAKKKLLAYHWPGNVRELANIIERSIVMEGGKIISTEHLFLEPQTAKPLKLNQLPVGLSLQELEKRFIIETLRQQENNRKKTAEMLGISLRKLQNKLQAFNLPNLK